jgi:hypothetical protein
MSEWIVIYKSNKQNETQIVKSVLEDNGIEVVLMNKMDSMHTHLMNAGLELHIKPDDVINAKYIISKNEL